MPERRTLIVWLEFEVNSATLDDDAKALLDEVIPVLQESTYRFEVGTHVDAEIGESDLDRLSFKRAELIRDYIVERGIAPDRLETHGYGTTEPLAESSPVRRVGGGRVEFKRID